MESLIIKLSGELLSLPNGGGVSAFSKPVDIRNIAHQIKKLSKNYHIGIVIGGGNFFRGDQHGKALKISAATGHQVGMLATLMNGALLQDILKQEDTESVVMSSFSCSRIAREITQNEITQTMNAGKIAIFVGGTGAPFFTTDTASVVRALQIESKTILKATKVDGVYDDDPVKNPDAKKIKQLTHTEALKHGLKIIDATALTLARQYKICFRVFDTSEEDALVKAVADKSFGSTICN